MLARLSLGRRRLYLGFGGWRVRGGETIRRDLLDIICCPVCKGNLDLKARREENEILEGELFCQQCNHSYPIEDGIPNLLPPDLQ